MVAQVPEYENTRLVDLKLEGINKRFDSQEVLRDFSLSVNKGELCCLLGPSGCGKTTALRIIDGLIDPDSGKVYLGETDITELPTQKRDLGFVFQNYALFPHMTIFENIAYGLRQRRLPNDEIKRKVAVALKMVRLAGYEKRRVHEVSGGEQQRIALARSLVIEPPLLLLDEPLSNLDARLRVEMRREIKRIQRELNITTIYVTHDQEEAMSIADRIVIINKGVIEQAASPWEIYSKPANLFVAGFIGNPPMNFLNVRVAGSGADLRLEGDAFRLPLPQDMKEALAAHIGKELTMGIRPEDVRTRNHNRAEAPAWYIQAKLESEELVGNETILHFRVGDKTVFGRTSSRAVAGLTEEVALTFDADRLHLFDLETGWAIA
ncbi:MAG: ABC transporter ATP-binding protein [Dehalococcoidia bacterium]|jgi:multiple sugar transport system ATP-binding protein